MKRIFGIFIMILGFIMSLAHLSQVWAQGTPGDAVTAELAKKTQNPVSDLISLPIEYWHYDGMANGASADVLILKPVVPVKLGNLNLVNRAILPYLWIDAGSGGKELGEIDTQPIRQKENGLGNIQYQGFLTPSKPSKVIWGIGPVFEFPTNQNNLGSEKWSAGPAAVVLAMPGQWVFGALAQNVWSYAGPKDAASVNKFTFQYFINYNLGSGWYLTSTPLITADWQANSSNRWTIPFGGGLGRLVRFGKLPVDFKLQAFGNLEKPDGGPDWSLQFALKFLFPK